MQHICIKSFNFGLLQRFLYIYVILMWRCVFCLRNATWEQ